MISTRLLCKSGFKYAVTPTILSASRVGVYPSGARTLSMTRPLENSLTATKSHQEAVSPHKRTLTSFFIADNIDRQSFIDDSSLPPPTGTTDLQKPGAVSTVPKKFRGDWVLFHPVYTREELTSVQVRLRNA